MILKVQKSLPIYEDTYIDQEHGTWNVGADSLLKLKKDIDGDNNIYESKLLFKISSSFDNDDYAISSSMLTLYNTSMSELSIVDYSFDFSLNAKLISGSWEAGTSTQHLNEQVDTYGITLEGMEGITYNEYTSSITALSDPVDTFTFNIYSSSFFSIKFDISNIMDTYVSSSSTYSGFQVEYASDDLSSDKKHLLQFYSKNTDSPYIPKIHYIYNEIIDDPVSASVATYDPYTDYKHVIYNMKESYEWDSEIIFKILNIPYSAPSFNDRWNLDTTDVIMDNLYYSIIDYNNYEIIINSLPIVYNDNFNFFKVPMNNFIRNRKYQILVHEYYNSKIYKTIKLNTFKVI